MLTETSYNRTRVVAYAEAWAMKRNPNYLNFDNIGGDCTNFASQCIFAGSGVMNYTPVMGWYYNSSQDRTASWSGVQYLANFLLSNTGAGPYAAETAQERLEIGDIIQLGRNEQEFYHTLVVTRIVGGTILICSHSYNAYMRPLNTYAYEAIRFLHMQGVRKVS
ncbi:MULTISPECIES: amidase domain-containing protein [Caproicibacterium]|uniref:Amidase domain-containing protein n=1 Tax=Caproicibacterium argilliputei TaxID=3030016 RepID=A0AA97DA19_9FIRM|nr:amidase domain-containing protein [Caproicibacterium argilliputei]WOC31581.1 amidase domain-containing protein [Caproicibacterium argilliputei]